MRTYPRGRDRSSSQTSQLVCAFSTTTGSMSICKSIIVWTAGPFVHPDFYREVIFPIYRELWKPLKATGKKVLFCSDGTVDMFIEDIAACGADGFIFEPSNNLDKIVRALGGTHMLAGSKVDCRTLAFGTWDQVKAEIDATLALTRGLPGFMFAVGNHIPANVSDAMCLQYMDYLRSNWAT